MFSFKDDFSFIEIYFQYFSDRDTILDSEKKIKVALKSMPDM